MSRSVGRFFAIVSLVVIIPITVFAGGSPEGAKPNSSGSAKKYASQQTISFASIQITEGRDYNEADELTKYFRQKFNVKWEIIPLNWENWAERLRVWINSGDMPDMATWNFIFGEAANYVEQGMLYKFPDDWKTRWPNLAKTYDDTILGPGLEKVLGGTYMLPKPVFSTNKPTKKMISHLSVILRKDWAKTVGFPIKDAYKMSEILDLARLIKEKDPGKVGSKLIPINMRPLFALDAFVRNNSAQYATFYKGSDGKYKWGAADQGTYVGLALLQKAYDEGLLNPEFYVVKGTEDYASVFTSGICGITYGEALVPALNRYDLQVKKDLKLDAKEILHAAAVIAEDGKYNMAPTLNFWTATIFSPKITKEKFERVMDMFDYAASEKGQLLIRMGFENVDFKHDEKGGLVNLIPDGKTMIDKYPSQHPVYGNMVILSDDFSLVNPAFPEIWRNRVKGLFKLKESLGDDKTIPSVDFNVFFHDSPDYRRTAFDYGTEFSRLIVEKNDIENKWKAWLKSKENIINPVLDELNTKSMKKK